MENPKQGSQFPSKEAGKQQQQGGKSSGQFPGAGGAGKSSQQQTQNQPGQSKQDWQKSGQRQT